MLMLAQGSAHALPLRSESVQTCVTSPPYWGLRAYAGEQGVRWPDGTCHQLGLEPTPELYVEHMVAVFREVRRVLRPDATLWLNLGDSYAGSWGAQGRDGQMADRSIVSARQIAEHPRFKGGRTGSRGLGDGLKPKDLVGIPWMVAFALRADGWWLRSDIVWSKPNPMPESVRDWPTKSHEYLFLLTKSERYFYDAAAIREPAEWARWGKQTVEKQYRGIKPIDMETLDERREGGRNARSVWEIATQPYPGAHFATYPERLAERCILAGSSPQACALCGAPWTRVTEREKHSEPRTAPTFGNMHGADGRDGERAWLTVSTLGWQPTCEHGDGSTSSIVLDPFNGSGTTGRVAVRHGRRYVGLDISREYLAEQSRTRIDRIQHSMDLGAAL